MNVAGLPDWLGKPLAVVLIDLLLAGDNALVIALVCRSLPPGGRRLVLLVGTIVAVVMRALLTGVAASVLAIPGLQLAGGVVLALLALNLALPAPRRPVTAPGQQRELVAAVILVVLVDVLMSLDNVLGLAAVAGDSFGYLLAGLLLSVSVVMFGSALVAGMLGRHPGLVRLGAALLAWVAGQMTMTDALDAGWIATQAPALPLVVPALAALYVLLVGGRAPAETLVAPIVAPRPRPARVAPTVRPEPEPADAPDATDPRMLAAFMALFVLAGVLLGAATIFGGGLAH